jgi:hypothetical protein
MSTPLRPPVSSAPVGLQHEPPKTITAAKVDNLGGWLRELHKFRNVEVTVDFALGNDGPSGSVTGRLVAYHPQGHHCIIDTTTESVFVRLPLRITRKRKHGA